MAGLDQVSLCISGFGADRSTGRVLRDWFEFLGGRPGEVVYVDGGSGAAAGARLARMCASGLIDRLELLNPAHPENSFDRCYIQEYRSGAMASRPYLCFVKLDTLPVQRGAGSWLQEDLRALEDPRIFAITSTHLIDPPRRRWAGRPGGREGGRKGGEGERGYLEYGFASLNFALMKRERFLVAMREQIGALIDSGFTGPYPEHLCPDTRWRRALVEWAWEAHCREHGLATLARPESREWMIFHINKRGGKLLEYRRRMRAGDGIAAFFDQPRAVYRPPLRAWQRWGRGLEGLARRARRAAGG
jgi:hypothetical protein